MEKTIQLTIGCCLTFLLCLYPLQAMGQNADIDLLHSIHGNRTEKADHFWKAVTNTTYPVAIGIPAVCLLTGFARHDSILVRNGIEMGVAVGINLVVTYGLKSVVNRQRPYEQYHFIHPYQLESDGSFPSGHTSFAFNTATSLALHTRKWYIAAPAYAWASAVGYSRLYLGVHYPTDVLGGALVGAGTAWLEVKGNEWLHHKKLQRAH